MESIPPDNLESGKTMASEKKATPKAVPVPAPASKAETVTDKASPVADKAAPAADAAAAPESGDKPSGGSGYSRGEGQKAVTQAYKDNWNAIFGASAAKKPTKKTATANKSKTKKTKKTPAKKAKAAKAKKKKL
jgi:hypothetical protein